MRMAAWGVFALFVAPAFGAASGRVVDPNGAPIHGAQVCEFVAGANERCVTSDSGGFYRIEKPSRASLLVRATGFVAKMVDASPMNAPVELRRAAALFVTVVDAATGHPLSSGRVMLDSPAGLRIGDFVPFNRLGVRIATLEPGVVFVRISAEGYTPAGPVPVELVGGAERSLEVPMTKSDKASR